jgi:plastocyanin
VAGAAPTRRILAFRRSEPRPRKIDASSSLCHRPPMGSGRWRGRGPIKQLRRSGRAQPRLLVLHHLSRPALDDGFLPSASARSHMSAVSPRLLAKRRRIKAGRVDPTNLCGGRRPAKPLLLRPMNGAIVVIHRDSEPDQAERAARSIGLIVAGTVSQAVEGFARRGRNSRPYPQPSRYRRIRGETTTMALDASGGTRSWKSRITPSRVAALALAAGLGVAACSPSGASTKSSAVPAPMNMATGPMIMTRPNSTPKAAPAPSGGEVAAAASAKVSIANFAFDPARFTVKTGTTVVWTNHDIVAHTVTFTDVANSPVLNRGDTFSRPFTGPGTFSYICSIHPFMHGTVVVTP